MTSHRLRLAGLAVAITLVLTGSTTSFATRVRWVTWLEREAGTPPEAAACVADRAWASFPPEVLEAAPRVGFSALPGGWRERIASMYVACLVATG